MWENPLAILATDIDGDGLDDIITATPRRIMINKNDGPYADFSYAGQELEHRGAIRPYCSFAGRAVAASR